MALIDDFMGLGTFDKPHYGGVIQRAVIEDAGNAAILKKHMEVCQCCPILESQAPALWNAALAIAHTAYENTGAPVGVTFTPMDRIAVDAASTDHVLKWRDDNNHAAGFLELDAEAWTDREQQEMKLMSDRAALIRQAVATYSDPELVVRSVVIDCTVYHRDRLDGVERTQVEQEHYEYAIMEKLNIFRRIARRHFPGAIVFFLRGGENKRAQFLAHQDARSIRMYAPHSYDRTMGLLKRVYRQSPRFSGDRHWNANIPMGGGIHPATDQWDWGYPDARDYMFHLGRLIAHEDRIQSAYMHPGPFDARVGTPTYMQAFVNYAQGYHAD